MNLNSSEAAVWLAISSVVFIAFTYKARHLEVEYKKNLEAKEASLLKTKEELSATIQNSDNTLDVMEANKELLEITVKIDHLDVIRQSLNDIIKFHLIMECSLLGYLAYFIREYSNLVDKEEHEALMKKIKKVLL